MRHRMIEYTDDVLGMIAELSCGLESGRITVSQLAMFLKGKNPFAVRTDMEVRQEWQRFYRKYFRKIVDFSSVVIPDNPGGFDRVIFIPKGLTIAMVVRRLQKKSVVHDSFDNDVYNNVRIPSTDYAIRVRIRQEADVERIFTSPKQLKRLNINCITLLEGLINELKWFDETACWLDINSCTLCAGSCTSDGDIPGVYRNPQNHTLHINRYNPDEESSDLRARQVVSN